MFWGSGRQGLHTSPPQVAGTIVKTGVYGPASGETGDKPGAQDHRKSGPASGEMARQDGPPQPDCDVLAVVPAWERHKEGMKRGWYGEDLHDGDREEGACDSEKLKRVVWFG